MSRPGATEKERLRLQEGITALARDVPPECMAIPDAQIIAQDNS